MVISYQVRPDEKQRLEYSFPLSLTLNMLETDYVWFGFVPFSKYNDWECFAKEFFCQRNGHYSPLWSLWLNRDMRSKAKLESHPQTK